MKARGPARRRALFAAGGALLLWACATSPLGRRQLILIPEGQMDAMGAAAFQDMKRKVPAATDPALNRYVRCVVEPITVAARGQTDVSEWEVVVFRDETANAFALPGGKIGVHTGILKVARTDAQLAAVLGHEVGHVIARHGAERVSEGLATQGGLAAIDAFVLGRSVSGDQRNLILGGLGLAAQVGVLLPFSRAHESEADLVGLDLMSRAGFDPRQSVELWRNMMTAGGGQPPQWLSTHPAHQTRISSLQANLPEALMKFERAQASGLRPHCER